MKYISWLTFALIFIVGIVILKYGNKNELEIKAEFEAAHPERSFDSKYLRIEVLDGHEYVIFTYGDAGGITHHEGCNH